MKRYKWTEKEDKTLKTILESMTMPVDWKEVQEKLNNEGIRKTHKQIRLRWKNHLDPNLKREEWNEKDQQKLLELYPTLKNKWLLIAEHFTGRTDNCIKNKFFSLIRKALRNSLKLRSRKERTCSTALINSIKPKVLGDLVGKIIPIKVDNKSDSLEHYNMTDFINKYAFNSFKEMYKVVDEKEIERIEQVWNYIENFNFNYQIKKKDKTVSKRKRIRKRKEKKTDERVKQIDKFCFNLSKCMNEISSGEREIAIITDSLNQKSRNFELELNISHSFNSRNQEKGLKDSSFKIFNKQLFLKPSKDYTDDLNYIRMSMVNDDDKILSKEEFNKQLNSVKKSELDMFFPIDNDKKYSTVDPSPINFITTFQNKATNCDLSLGKEKELVLSESNVFANNFKLNQSSLVIKQSSDSY